ncbi:lyase family protein [Rudaeicoccus suwonensis]|uniref:3-carboxy-cis,cis-muconate cycloisomerase n=1 Tax=Rudaeicoccus suwonensis TaxID=657409 RepID=A0A561E6W1_9MICO|nr:lyase family protein [Rudaeicoccus suwonensis]TWE11365.1 3-carboxy-cis,cis-muconate cycloisomerase [Rudaeicoccus suwonensis]
MSILLQPWRVRAGGLDDVALVEAVVTSEVAWLDVLEHFGTAPVGVTADARQAWESFSDKQIDWSSAGEQAHQGANPVIGLVSQLRSSLTDAAGEEQAWWVHRGLTSQDVLDTALLVLAREALVAIRRDLRTAGDSLARHATRYRTTPALARTLGQPALPTTWGMRIATWLNGIREADHDLSRLELPVQCGGAVGTSAALVELGIDPVAAATRWAELLELAPRPPWHTMRLPVTRLAAVLAQTTAACGHIAVDVLTLSRAEVAEADEPVMPGRGGSSTMPQKVNPVLSVQLRAIALQSPADLSTVVTTAGLAADERSDGAWQAEWAPLQQLLIGAVAAASITAELASGLVIDERAAKRNLTAAMPGALAEQAAIRRDGQTPHDPTTYLGNATALVDQAVHDWENS